MLQIEDIRSHAEPFAAFQVARASGALGAEQHVTREQSVRLDREVDMTWHVLNNLSRLRCGDSPSSILAAEVQCAAAVADLAEAEFDVSELDRRKADELGPIPLALRIHVLDEISNRGIRRIDTLARRVGSSSGALTRSTLRPLADAGVIELNKGELVLLRPWIPLARSITTVELKLSDWKGALSQARSQARSADYNWVVLSEMREATLLKMLPMFRQQGTGLALLGRDGSLRTVVRPRKQYPLRWVHGLLAENIWQATIAAGH